jgi:hypothetical protein
MYFFFFSLVSSGSPRQVTAQVFVQWVYRSAASESGEYRRCFFENYNWFYVEEFINFKLKLFFLVVIKYVLISSSPSKNAITIHYGVSVLSTLPLHHVVAMYFILFDKWGVSVAFHLEGWERRRKELG